MTIAARLLAVWLTPVLWFEMPAVIVERGPEGLWIGFALMLAPLIALGAMSREDPAVEREPLLVVVALLFTIAVLLAANMALAGDVASAFGFPRWTGIAVTAAAGWLFTGWRGVRRLVPLLLLVTVLAMSAPLAERVRATGVGPLGAWARVASQTAFRFPLESPWVTAGRDLTTGRGHTPIVFDEEHRVTAPAGGRLQARVVDGRRVADLEWTLGPGQSVTLRPGDRLDRRSPIRLRFEADKRVPGSPASGIAWAAGVRPDWPPHAGLLLTLLFGALALLHAGPSDRIDRLTVVAVGGGALLALLWAQGWAIYSLLEAPDVFLDGLTPERLLDVAAFGSDHPVASTLPVVSLAGAFASFLASSIALRERLRALDRTGSGEIGYDLTLWAGMFAIAALVSLRPMDPWFLVLFALGTAASTLGPVTVWSRHTTGVAMAAEVVGLLVFASLSLMAQFRAEAGGLTGAALAYPALVAVPAGALMLWLGGLASRR